MGLTHLQKVEGKVHSVLLPSDIRISKEGIVKLLPFEMIGVSTYQYQLVSYQPGFVLGATLMSCITLQ